MAGSITRQNKLPIAILFLVASLSLLSFSLLAADSLVDTPTLITITQDSPELALQGNPAKFEDAKELLARFAGLQSLRAAFSQQMRDEKGALLDESEGEVIWMRPLRFRWDIHAPFKQSIVINDGKHYQYDVDLEQLIVRELTDEVARLPRIILAGSLEGLTQDYEVSRVRTMAKNAVPSDTGTEELSTALYRLTPRISDENTFELQSMLFAFAGEELVEINIVDSLGQTSRFELKRSEGIEINEKDFEINAPDSTFTIYQ